ncbi:MAG: DUF3237 family protein [Rhizobiales bacterium]|nr:DUF3237 family protein [Hyphomicrobiales bacterium]
MRQLESEFLFEIEATLEAMQDVGLTPTGHRMIAYVKEGRFTGPKMKGKVLAGGGDWALVRGDGVLVIDVRITIETDDGVRIYVSYGGRISGSPEVLGQLLDPTKAGDVDPASYYFRTNPLFDAPVNSDYAWLNGMAAIGIGRFTSTGVSYDVHLIR